MRADRGCADGLVKTEEQRQQIYDVVLRETMRLSRLVNDMLELSRLQKRHGLALPEASLPRSRCSTSSTRPIPPTPRTISRPSSTTCRKTCRAFGAIRIAPSRCSSCCWITPSSIPPEGGSRHAERLRGGRRCPRPRPRHRRGHPRGGSAPCVRPLLQGRINPTTARGTDLGLAIAYEIMKHLGEEMSVTSEPGQGSCFTFTLHIAQGSAEKTAELPKAPA